MMDGLTCMCRGREEQSGERRRTLGGGAEKVRKEVRNGKEYCKVGGWITMLKVATTHIAIELWKKPQDISALLYMEL